MFIDFTWLKMYAMAQKGFERQQLNCILNIQINLEQIRTYNEHYEIFGHMVHHYQIEDQDTISLYH